MCAEPSTLDRPISMSKYTLWDIPSSSLLLKTHELDVVTQSTENFVSENGLAALSELLLGIEPDDSSPVHDHSGGDILEAMEREQ